MEQKPKKREWVKNAAIIFLAVMLVLTFFSNTILNRTLPEVVTRYVEPNSIDAKVRISGTVSACENYDVILDQTRKVAAVNVKLGQSVSTGDVLFTLESGDSDELENAKRELETAQRNYQRFLIGLSDFDYSSDNREIALLRSNLDEAIARRDAMTMPAQVALDAAAASVDRAKADVDAIDTKLKSYDIALKEAQVGEKYSSDGSDNNVPDNLKAAKSAAESAKEQARRDYISAKTSFKDQYQRFKEAILDHIEEEEQQREGSGFVPLTDEERSFVTSMIDEIFGLEVAGYSEDIINRYNASSSVLKDVREALQAEKAGFEIIVLGHPDSKETEKEKAKRVLKETSLRIDYVDLMPEMFKNASDYNIHPDAIAAYIIIADAQERYAAAANDLRAAKAEISSWIAENPSEDAVKYEGKTHSYWVKEVDRISLLIDETNLERESAQAVLDDTKAAQEALKQQQVDYKEAENDVADCQKLLEDRLFALAQQQKSDGKTQMLNSLEIQEKQEELAELQKRIDEYSGNEFTEVKAKVNGTVASLSVSAGHKAEAGSTLATIEVEDLGYTMTAKVSVDQARLLHVGDTATVSNYYWGSRTTAVLSNMQPDPQDPRTSRMLTFDLAGDVNAGDQISFSIGEKNANYDLVVPNSALRSDSSGSFVLMITAKNSPLGNRYFATRVDVEVIASDDYNTAVKGALSNMDSVITTSSGNAPVKNGDQVRLADTNG